MFERNRVDNSRETGGMSVELTLIDGTVLTGKISVPVSGSIADVLNGSAPFVEFEPFVGERLYLAKSGLRSVAPVVPARTTVPPLRYRDIDGFDPWQTLGLKRGDTLEAAKAAYHSHAKSYHPDLYASAELPTEVRDYLAAMARRITTAYTLIEEAHAASRRIAEARSEPVFARGAN